MTTFNDFLALASAYHEALPPRIRNYLNGRGISGEVIDLHQLGWTGQRISIPIFNREGTLTFFKLAKDPDDKTDSPKMLASPGASADLYGWERVKAKPCRIVICEGEFDRLVLESRGLAAVTSTGGAGVFREEWAEAFAEIPEVCVCFDRDEAGRAGALKVARLIPHAKLVELPEEVGDGGDVTDFFVCLGRSTEDFLQLLDQAQPAPPQAQAPSAAFTPTANGYRSPFSDRVARLKSMVPIVNVVASYVDLRPMSGHFRGHCPFHDDGTPSFVVYPKTGTFHCFGCQKHGDVITFLMTIANLTFLQAVEALDRLSHHDRDTEDHR
jgi:DNA primase